MVKFEETIAALISFSGSVAELKEKLSFLEWDFTGEVQVLKKSNVIKVIDRYLRDDLSSSDVEWWSNAIECREQIDFDTKDEASISKAIDMLANPVLYKEGTYKELAVVALGYLGT